MFADGTLAPLRHLNPFRRPELPLVLATSPSLGGLQRTYKRGTNPHNAT